MPVSMWERNRIGGYYPEQAETDRLEIHVNPDPQIEGKVVGILKRKEKEEE